MSRGEAQTISRDIRRRKIVAFTLVLPLLLFLTIAFFAPIGSMLVRSVYSPTVSDLLPKTLTAFSQWDHESIPNGYIIKTFAVEFRALAERHQDGPLGSDLNQLMPGTASIFQRTGNRLRKVDVSHLADAAVLPLLVEVDPTWGTVGIWQGIAEAGHVLTARYYLNTLGFTYKNGRFVRSTAAKIYLTLYLQTLQIASIITLLCFVLGYPLAYFLAKLPQGTANSLMIFVLLPFFTSLLVRTSAWIALLQPDGVINTILMSSHIIKTPLNLLYTEFATIVAMTHILLPFMILPLYSVMKGIDPSYVRAAVSLGSTPLRAFLRIFFPLTLPGVSAGVLLVFIISVGYYITPALVGGSGGQMISNIIAFNIQSVNNWGLAAALGSLLLLIIIALYWIYDRLVGVDTLKVS